ncbi:F-box protein At5g18160-like [Bidens hawaiensis]|uniref:F-box protein At5g18160-like n=1 Tax=Bidens hawaiensis TaxID=980011 RepID=UPI004049636D
MSDNIPFEIQTDIIKRVVPVKSFIRFRFVCKQWKSLIDSSKFITHHTLNHTHQNHVLLRYSLSSEKKCVSVVDDDDHSFPHDHCSIPVPPVTATKVMLDSSHGLVFLLGFTPDANKLAVVWNPSIRKSVRVVPPVGTTVVGFGVCPKTIDLKIFAITGDSKAHVFTLSTRAWRCVPMNLSGYTSFESSYNQVVIDGVIHSGAYDPKVEYRQRIITFDLTSEEFGEVVLPSNLVYFQRARISKLEESLAVIAYHENAVDMPVYDIMVMCKNGVAKPTFTKLLTITNKSSCYFNVIGFRKNGQAVIERDVSLEKELEVYERDSNNMKGIGIYGSCFDMVNYTESLLLLNLSESIIQ